MPLVTVVCAAYFAYQTQKQVQKQSSSSSSAGCSAEEQLSNNNVSTKGKSKIALLPAEESLSILELPITSINFFRGNYQNVASHLEHRVEAILKVNPWLAGWLIRDKDDANHLKISYDPEGKDRPQGGHFTAFEPFVIPISQQTTEYREYSKLLKSMGVMLPANHKLIGKDAPFFKVALIPDATEPDGGFAITMSLSHAVADSGTFYTLLQMLDVDNLVMPLIAERNLVCATSVQEQTETNPGDYIRNAVQKPPIDLTGTRNEESVYRMFYVHEDWLLQQKSRRVSVFDKNQEGSSANLAHSPAMATSVSANSIIASWFFKLTQCTVGFMTVDLRNRLDDSTAAVSSEHAGNYTMALPYTPCDYHSPGLIQESLLSLRRCGSDPPTPLPMIAWNTTASLALNWATYFREELYLHDQVQQINHLPLYDADILGHVPGRLSMIFVFTAKPTSINGEERRAGAIVLCRQSIWEKIRECGIVDEMIAEF